MDRTLIAARTQLTAIGAETYEIGVLAPSHARKQYMEKRIWNIAQLERGIGWLKRKNANGANVYVRAAGEENCGVILVDDIPRSTVERMEADGLRPCCVVETSPWNMQAWVRVSALPLTRGMATGIGRYLAHTYGGDQASIDWRHLGRLAGFTNRKPQHVREDGTYPYVLVESSHGGVIKNPAALIERSEAFNFSFLRARQERLGDAAQTVDASPPTDSAEAFGKHLYRHVSTLKAQESADLSRHDFMVATRMLSRGYNQDDITDVIRSFSPGIETRKAGHISDYIKRTITAAAAAIRQTQTRENAENGH